MRTPEFWKKKNYLSFLLYPLSLLYLVGRYFDVFFSKKYKANNIKIICIGNVVVGGAGKTPITIKLGKLFKKKKIKFAFLSKGYKGSIKTFQKVDINKHTYKDVGDEPLLLSEINDTYICHNRKEAIKKISKLNKYDYIIMDDGFQNTSIYKDINILVIDGEYGLGNNQLIPSGPLRENLHSALKRTSIVMFLNNDKFYLKDKIKKYKNISIIDAKLIENSEKNKNKSYIAFSGIGRNEKFFNSLKKNNFNILDKYFFEDHHNYTKKEINNLIKISKKNKSKLITTKKDWIKLDKKYKNVIEYLDIDIHFFNENKILKLLINKII